MTATSHALVGAIIAAKIGNPALAVPIALASHIIGDIIPHWDTGTGERKKNRQKIFYESFVDVMLGFVLSFLLLRFIFPATNLEYAFFIILVAQSFDWLTAPYYFFKINLPPFNWAYKFQKIFDNNKDKPLGIITQVTFVLIVFLFAVLF